MTTIECDVAVVGAGIQGSCTALYLAKAGKKVSLIEQFPLPHTRGSSHGQSRIIRSAYPEEYFTLMMKDAFDHWRQIEKETGKELIWNTGVLLFSPPPYEDLENSERNMAKFYPDSLDQVTYSQVKTRYPMINFSEDIKFYVDKTGGVVKASIALETVQSLFRKYGGKILDGCAVSEIKADPGKVVLKASDKVITASSAVICCGPWANKVLKLTDIQLPLQPQRVTVFYFKEKNPGQYSRKAGYPTILCLTTDDRHVYSLPSIEYPGLVKICVHSGVNSDPDERDKTQESPEDRKILRSFIERYLPDLEREPSVVEPCMYTVSPDEVYILDRHPKYSNIIVGAGFSGHGFKMATVVGEILGDLAIGKEPRHDMRPFLISRFN